MGILEERFKGPQILLYGLYGMVQRAESSGLGSGRGDDLEPVPVPSTEPKLRRSSQRNADACAVYRAGNVAGGG
jgi:hypothetical protein